jgi:hypothetical protein
MEIYDIIFIVKIFYKNSNVDFIIQNIFNFNKNNKILLLLNISEYLYDKLNILEITQKYKNVVLFRCKSYRTKFDPHVISCVTNCMNYIIYNYKCTFIILCHDSEVYIKQVDINIITKHLIRCKKQTFIYENVIQQLTQTGENCFWWKRFMELENMFNYFLNNKIVPMIDVCPGLTITYDTMCKIIHDLNILNSDFYLNHNKRVLLDEIIYHSLIMYHEGEYYNINYTYWTNNKREALQTEEDTLNLLINDLKNNNINLNNKFSIKKSYKNVCNYIENNLYC